jgi:hypothetical protein
MNKLITIKYVDASYMCVVMAFLDMVVQKEG